jgi:hypothetical protein
VQCGIAATVRLRRYIKRRSRSKVRKVIMRLKVSFVRPTYGAGAMASSARLVIAREVAAIWVVVVERELAWVVVAGLKLSDWLKLSD